MFSYYVIYKNLSIYAKLWPDKAKSNLGKGLNEAK